jgi:3-deoxy-manno-octulosonate cytidylyltransferase (CMP-KDO synthetase)
MSTPICIIPVRMASSRYPGKPLKPLLGLALVLHVYERCRHSKTLDRVVIATCDNEIKQVVEAYGCEVVMTADTHPGCVDRTEEAISKVAPELSDDELVLMVQGDEVLVSPDMVDQIVIAYRESGAPVVNLVSRLKSTEDHDNPNCVKVAATPEGRALFFSRSPIPSRTRSNDVPMYQQTGIIGFSKSFLFEFGRLPRTPLEMIEGIDMLRTLEHGHPIQLVFTDTETIGVDTPADLSRAEEALRSDPITAQYLGAYT